MPRMNADEGRRAESRPSSPGRMTVAMRATSGPPATKVLRVGLVLGGRIVEERVVTRRTSVSIGTSERSTFVLGGALPPEFELFERVGKHYRLNLLDTMGGRMAMGHEIVDLDPPSDDELRASGQSRTEPVRRMRLTEDARGKVVVGDATFLFQFVTAPAAPPRPQLPLSVRGGFVAQIDVRLAVIAALSFLVHFGLVGAFYSDWMDSVVAEDITAQFIDTLVREPVPPPVETSATNAEAPSSVPATPETETPRTPTRTTPPATHRPESKSTSALVAEARRLEIDVIGSIEAGRNAQAVLQRDNGPPVDLNAIAQKADGVTNRADPLHGWGDSGPILPGPSPLPLIPRDIEMPPAASTAGPTRRIALAPILPDVLFTGNPNVSNAEATIRRQIEPGARRCYERGLQVDPAQAGRLVLAIQIAASGEVDSATPTQNTGLSAAVAKCIADVARRATFDRPTGGAALLSVPFTFLKQR